MLMQSIFEQVRASRAFAKFIYVQRVKGFPPPDDVPQLDKKALQKFQEELGKASAYLEFGSGGSTVLADQAEIVGVSVESDRYYARSVRSRLTNHRIKILTPKVGVTGEWGTPLFSTVTKGLRYADAAFPMFPFPDFILVDGRYRVACALETARQAHLAGKRATLMVDDYVSRSHYGVLVEHLGSPEVWGRAAIFGIGKLPVDRADVVLAAYDKR